MGTPDETNRRSGWHRIEAGLAAAALGVIRLLPASLALWAGRSLGRISWTLLRGARRRTLENLELAYGTALTARERRRIGRGVFGWIGRMTVETMLLPRFLTPQRWDEHVRFEDPEALDRLRTLKGPGILFVTGHLGNWEALFAALVRAGFKMATVARRMDNPYLYRRFAAFRATLGQKLLTKEDALWDLARELRAGTSIGLLVDQSPRHAWIFTDFFGHPAATSSGPAMLALRLRCPIVVASAYRDPSAPFRFTVTLSEPILPPAGERAEGAARRMAQEFTARIEELIRRRPQEWLWIHQRWKRKSGHA